MGEYFYCLVCAENLRDGPGARRRHNSSEKHGERLYLLLSNVSADVRERHRSMREPVMRSACVGNAAMKRQFPLHWMCRLCETFVDDTHSDFAGFAIYQHLAGKMHEKKTEKFLKSFLSPEQRQRFKKKHFRLTQGAFAKYREKTTGFMPPPAPVLLDRLSFMDGAAMPDIAGSLVPSPVTGDAAKRTDRRKLESIGPSPASLTPGTRPFVPSSEDISEQGASISTKNVREEIIQLVAEANVRARKKKAKNPLRHKRLRSELTGSPHYLPSFGDVWNSGPRSGSEKAFRKRRKLAEGRERGSA